MSDDEHDRDRREFRADPFQHQVGPDLLHQPEPGPQNRDAAIDPAAAKAARKHGLAELAQLGIALVRPHVLKIVELAVGAHFARIERLEHQAAGYLRADELREPGRAAPARSRYQEALALVAPGVAVEVACKRPCRPPAQPLKLPLHRPRDRQGRLPPRRQPATTPGSNPSAYALPNAARSVSRLIPPATQRRRERSQWQAARAAMKASPR